ncbi:MAG: hypothetical protein WBO09_11510 [Methylocystis silviterrae]
MGKAELPGHRPIELFQFEVDEGCYRIERIRHASARHFHVLLLNLRREKKGDLAFVFNLLFHLARLQSARQERGRALSSGPAIGFRDVDLGG